MTASKAKPIPFSGPMVRAILDGRKTMTRRVLKPQPICDHALFYKDKPTRMVVDDIGAYCAVCGAGVTLANNAAGVKGIPVRYAPGELLWVKETWKPHSFYARTRPRDIPVSKVFYRADDSYAPSDTPWRSLRYMPRWASRITLEVTEVRVQRLQEISREDAEAEGIEKCVSAALGLPSWSVDDRAYFSATSAFSMLWESLHGPGSWAENPWVAAWTFRRIDRAGEIS